MLSERMQGVDVGGDSVIREVSRHNPTQPLTLLCNRVMPPAPQLITDVPQRCAHAITLAIPAQQESAIASLCAYVRESEKVEGLRPSLAPPGSTLGSVFAKLDQTGFLRVEGASCPSWVIRVIPAIPACPVRPKSGRSANARGYEYTLAYLR